MSSILEGVRRYEIEQALKGLVKCPRACHGFGRCGKCADTGLVYDPYWAERRLEELEYDENKDAV